jgi:pimeloyl-ACP methyl ester carboxylesterase
VDLTERSGPDALLQVRNDVMTVYREAVAADGALFPLRYARATPPPDGSDNGRVIGPGGRVPTVLVIPDGPGNASVLPYDHLRRSLSEHGLDVIMVEHRGVGLSRLDARGNDLPPEAIRLDAVIADLVAVLDHALVDRAVVHGTGYGALLALMLAARHPERVEQVVLDSPWTGEAAERVSQRRVREVYWEGRDVRTDTIASALRRLDDQAVIDARQAGTVILAVHEYAGTTGVRELVDLLAQGRGQVTWTSVRQVLTGTWFHATPYLHEPDLVSRIACTELGSGIHADGGPMDPLLLTRTRALGQDPYQGPGPDVLARAVRAPTLVVSGLQDLMTPPEIAAHLTDAIPDAALLTVPRTGHSVLDSHAELAQVIIRWCAAGVGRQLLDRADELARLPRTATDQAIAQGLNLALAVERISPARWRWGTVSRWENARLTPPRVGTRPGIRRRP